MVVWMLFNVFVLLISLPLAIGCNRRNRTKAPATPEDLTEAERRKHFTPVERAQKQIADELSEYSRSKNKGKVKREEDNSSKNAKKDEKGKSANRRVKRSIKVTMADTRPPEQNTSRRSRLHDLVQEYASEGKSARQRASTNSGQRSVKRSDLSNASKRGHVIDLLATTYQGDVKENDKEKKSILSKKVKDQPKHDEGAQDHALKKHNDIKEASIKASRCKTKENDFERDEVSSKKVTSYKKETEAQDHAYMVAESMNTAKSEKKLRFAERMQPEPITM